MTKPMDAYIRVSRVAGREGDSFISPDVQREAIEAWAKANGVEIANWYVELDESGKNRNRPQLTEALERARAGLTGGIVAAKLDRISRSLAHLGDLIEEARRGGWNIVALDLGLDLRSGNGKLVANVLGSVAEWELDRRTQDWNQAVTTAIGAGKYISAKPPIGYRKGKDGRLVVDPEVAPIIRQVFRLRARLRTA
jgi:DNA invertase Pin-like site-specific DNA recombinase